MTTPDFPPPHSDSAPANDADATPQQSPSDPNTFIATLKRIGSGAAADGLPWPERHPLPGRQLALEMLLAAERVRQNGPEEQYVGDRVMEGLVMACLSLSVQAGTLLRPG